MCPWFQFAREGQLRAGWEGVGMLARIEAEVLTLPIAGSYRMGRLFIAGGALFGGGREAVAGLEDGNFNSERVIGGALGGARAGLDLYLLALPKW